MENQKYKPKLKEPVQKTVYEGPAIGLYAGKIFEEFIKTLNPKDVKTPNWAFVEGGLMDYCKNGPKWLHAELEDESSIHYKTYTKRTNVPAKKDFERTFAKVSIVAEKGKVADLEKRIHEEQMKWS